MKNILFLSLIMISNLSFAQNKSISVQILGFSNNKGMAFLELLDKNEKSVVQKVLPIINKQVNFKIEEIPVGQYAIKVFHDENNNQKLDINFLGIPKEKWGVSNNVPAYLGPPDFKKMLFYLKDDIEIEIKLK